jgi:acetoin utilization deacetylase AcuC-like enzyme
MPVVWSDRHRLHEPGGEVWVGVRTPGTEVPERAERIREALEGAGARFVDAAEQPDEAVLAVHDAAMADYLATAWDEWEASGLTEDPGQDRVVPYLFPHPGLVAREASTTGAGATAASATGGGAGAARATGGGAAAASATLRTPTAIAARAGRFAYDTMTLIGPGTWDAARAAVDCAVTAADLVLAGAPAAYACCRPPCHHATRTAFGGSCYLNNTAAAAARLREKTGGTVAVLDIDAHHGNGTQSIFHDDPAVLTGSVHVDPAAGWFPHYLGFADETGGGDNRNVPLAPGTGDEAWLEAVAGLAEWGAPAALVVALGVDAAGGDPESPLEVTAEGFRKAGRILGGMGLPTVVVQEGGYDLDQIGLLVLEVLAGIEEGANG